MNLHELTVFKNALNIMTWLMKSPNGPEDQRWRPRRRDPCPGYSQGCVSGAVPVPAVHIDTYHTLPAQDTWPWTACLWSTGGFYSVRGEAALSLLPHNIPLTLSLPLVTWKDGPWVLSLHISCKRNWEARSDFCLEEHLPSNQLFEVLTLCHRLCSWLLKRKIYVTEIGLG